MADAPSGVPLRVVSYNVHGQRDDVAALATVVRQLAPDVVIVQEGPRRFGWRAKSVKPYGSGIPARCGMSSSFPAWNKS